MMRPQPAAIVAAFLRACLAQELFLPGLVVAALRYGLSLA